MAPVILKAKETSDFSIKVLNTAQHKGILDPYWEIFDIYPDYTLDFMFPNQSLSELTSRAVLQFQSFLDGLVEKPSLVIAQGDTTTVMVASIVSFYNKIPFGHLEAGLRTYDYDNPFPEEFNRRVAGLTTSVHFVPTKRAFENLVQEGVSKNKLLLTGNTVVDAIELIQKSSTFGRLAFSNDQLNTIKEGAYVIITCHRRENQGKNLAIIIDAVEHLAIENRELSFVWLLHPNPNIITMVTQGFKNITNVILNEPLNYLELLKLISGAGIILTDSGGIQEEAPTFSKPVIVLREKTERPESVERGYSKLVGANKEKIIATFNEFKNKQFTKMENPYGDGRASERIIHALKKLLVENKS